jgi:hypothetical protein
MSLRLRVILAGLGLSLLCLAAVTLVYRWWPLGVTREDFRPAPTLFAPPEGYALERGPA